ncbi:ABC transporter permease [Paenibacillus athensensis]|uniref:ABC transporter permease n=1 Tax=Paenibacillus athensensis TaxID=1967502 RepID=A0A4Y8Q599_9BACL|nr:ABC transporter permease [Paenibacillus athensensis]MCD1259586.1 ABC transporter permease [Paenibacillus athensensis]
MKDWIAPVGAESALRRTAAALLFDLRFQWRHGFYYAYMLLCALYIALLNFVPDDYLTRTIILLTFSDPSALGLLFAGGLLLLERGQGLHDCLFMTPLRLSEYLLGKALSLALLSAAAAFAVHICSAGWPPHPELLAAGVMPTSAFFTLIGLTLAAHCRTLNGFILLTQAGALIFVLPLLGYLGLAPDSPLYGLLPTRATLLLLDDAYRQTRSTGDLAVSALSLLLWLAAAFALARRTLRVTTREHAGRGGQPA